MKNMMGSEARKRLNDLREKLFVDHIKLAMNQEKENHPNISTKEDVDLDKHIKIMTDTLNDTTEEMLVCLGQFSPSIMWQIFERFNAANRVFQKIGDREIAVDDRDSDFLNKSLLGTYHNQYASLVDEE
jgi:hypothetical protein